MRRLYGAGLSAIAHRGARAPTKVQVAQFSRPPSCRPLSALTPHCRHCSRPPSTDRLEKLSIIVIRIIYTFGELSWPRFAHAHTMPAIMNAMFGRQTCAAFVRQCLFCCELLNLFTLIYLITTYVYRLR